VSQQQQQPSADGDGQMRVAWPQFGSSWVVCEKSTLCIVMASKASTSAFLCNPHSPG
jgi:hypothetical protein